MLRPEFSMRESNDLISFFTYFSKLHLYSFDVANIYLDVETECPMGMFPSVVRVIVGVVKGSIF